MSINKVIISGNLTRDPDLRSTASGMSVLSFGVAVNDRRRNAQTGEWEDYPNFIDCTLFGSRGEALSKYLTKGQKVAVEGKLRWSQWERDGQKRSKIEVIVDELEFMSNRNGGSGAGNQGGYASNNNNNGGYASNNNNNNNGYASNNGYGQQNTGYSQPANSAPVFDASAVYDEDIPF
ncbi:MAG: single-stranded DNA-binding protein [Coriobacteriia bacterium]|nr:single-stranded DNA-binding protein [Coriobacteriia bacterium]